MRVRGNEQAEQPSQHPCSRSELPGLRRQWRSLHADVVAADLYGPVRSLEDRDRSRVKILCATVAAIGTRTLHDLPRPPAWRDAERPAATERASLARSRLRALGRIRFAIRDAAPE